MEGFDALGEWLEPIPSEAGLHAAARIRDPDQAQRILALVREHAPGAQSTNEYAMAPLKQPAIAFGYGVIATDEITARLTSLRAALSHIG